MLAPLRPFTVACALGALFASSGCDLFGLGGDGTSLVQVLVTHHATPEDGTFPDRRNGLGDQEFETDTGWTVTLDEAFVVTASTTLHACDGSEIPFDRYWGPLPENLGAPDLDAFTFGGIEVKAGSYCSISVTYGPYEAPPETARMHEMPDDEEALVGATFYLSGFARKGDQTVEFELSSTDELVIELPIEADDGGPLEISGDEAFPLELTLSKTYDRLFDGIDFETMDTIELEANALAVLGLETRLSAGTVVAAQ